MRTVSFKSVWTGAARKAGLDPDYLTQAVKSAIAEHVNAWMRRSWTAFAWPEIVAIGAFRYRDDYASGTAYAAGDQVWYGEAYYQALVATTGNAPTVTAYWVEASAVYETTYFDAATAYEVGERVSYGDYFYQCIAASTGNLPTDATYWAVLEPFIRSIDMERASATGIGEVFEVYAADPRTTKRAATLRYNIGPDGVVLDPDAPDRVWMEYSARPPVFTLDPWSASTAYVAGDLVYLDPHTYRATASGTNHTPPNASYWSQVECPYLLAEIVKRGVFAELLREDGQHEKATIEKAEAETGIEEEISNSTTRNQQRARFGPRNDQ